MDDAREFTEYDGPRLLPCDGRARLVRFRGRDAELLTPGEGVMLFSAGNEYMGSFESPQHARLWCAAEGVEVRDEIEETDLERSAARSPFARRYRVF